MSSGKLMVGRVALLIHWANSTVNLSWNNFASRFLWFLYQTLGMWRWFSKSKAALLYTNGETWTLTVLYVTMRCYCKLKFDVDIFHVIYQSRETGFDHISKPREESWKYDAKRSIFNEIWGVWKCDQTLSWVFDIIFSIETKTKEEIEK